MREQKHFLLKGNAFANTSDDSVLGGLRLSKDYFRITEKVSLIYHNEGASRCYNYAVSEAVRLLDGCGITVEKINTESSKSCLFLQLSVSGHASKKPEMHDKETNYDAYRFTVSNADLTISSTAAKGILNGVYDLAERMGYLFLYPGPDGEWVPSFEQVAALTTGDEFVSPRFPYRGVFWEGKNADDFTDEAWLRFYAKLRFNALRHEIDDLPLAEELGLRLEVGGHDLTKLVSREHFDEHPEWYRMVQPVDFGGQRSNDLNYSVTNEEARSVVKKNFRAELNTLTGIHAVHKWPDDLPGGGWCYSPTSRAFSPADQALLAMRCLAEVVEEENLPLRIPVLAYHDTLFPGTQIDVSKECFLLFAPRERCYGHALDDPSCKRNQVYCEALKKWMNKFEGINDAHTFEYYFDQILFRGIYPFLPKIIIADMHCYKEHKIECHMSLQVGGPAIAPEYNMLLFARAQWDEDLTAESYIDNLAKQIAPGQSDPWCNYLTRRAQIYAEALLTCEHDLNIYFDYRWLPETTTNFGKKIAQAYEDASIAMDENANNLEKAIVSQWPTRLRKLAKKEINRSRFEAAELHVMHLQQSAMCQLGSFLNTREAAHAREGVALLKQTIDAQEKAVERALEAKLSRSSYYFTLAERMLRPEFEGKIEKYSAVTDD